MLMGSIIGDADLLYQYTHACFCKSLDDITICVDSFDNTKVVFHEKGTSLFCPPFLKYMVLLESGLTGPLSLSFAGI